MNWAQDHILGLENGKQRYTQTVTRLSQAFALAVPNECHRYLQIRWAKATRYIHSVG